MPFGLLLGRTRSSGRVNSSVEFEWDPEKATANAKKHGVEFTEATTVFGDPSEVTIPDPDHSEGESRFLSMGSSVAGRLLVVSYTERGQSIRIINARIASAHERKQYESTKSSES
jgi:uncharacterized protein